MLTSQDIKEKAFDKSVRGYNADQVDQFLDEIEASVAQYMELNASLTEQLEAANAKLDEYKAQEGSVIRTLESARALMNDISASAEKRADIIVKNAQLDADQIIRSARDSVEKLRTEEKDLENKVGSIRQRLKNILTAELDRFEKMDQDIFGTALSKNSVSDIVDQAAAQAQFDRLTRVDMEPVEEKLADDKDDILAEKFRTRVLNNEE